MQPQPLQATQPLQRPGIPFWIAGGGEKVTLKIETKKAKGADLLTQFLRDYKHGAMNKFASNVVKASRTLQRFYRSFAVCTQARLKLLLELYAEVDDKIEGM